MHICFHETTQRGRSQDRPRYRAFHGEAVLSGEIASAKIPQFSVKNPQKDEYGAFSTIVDRHPLLASAKAVFIADRGFCSYNIDLPIKT